MNVFLRRIIDYRKFRESQAGNTTLIEYFCLITFMTANINHINALIEYYPVIIKYLNR